MRVTSHRRKKISGTVVLEVQISTDTLSSRRIMTRIKKLNPGKKSFRLRRREKSQRKDGANPISSIPKRESLIKKLIVSMET